MGSKIDFVILVHFYDHKNYDNYELLCAYDFTFCSIVVFSSFTDASDYAAVGSLQTMIPVGSTVGLSSRICVTVSLVDDNLLEENGEIFSVRLQSKNAEVSSSNNIDVFITDDDGN